MTKMSTFSQIEAPHADPSAEVEFRSQPHPTAPDPVMLEKIGKGLHELYDGVPRSTLPIYFGPVLGELYLTPLSRRRSA
jgi:hypothetical protein